MARIRLWPEESLTETAQAVEHGESCRDIIEEMFSSMDYPNGIGVAAPQIGVDKRIIVVNVPNISKGKRVAGSVKHHLINPEIIWWKGDLKLDYEGCLSFPGERVMVPRRPRIKVRGFDLRWNPITIGAKDLVARVFQHEIDHLNGRTLDFYAKLAEEAFEEQDSEAES